MQLSWFCWYITPLWFYLYITTVVLSVYNRRGFIVLFSTEPDRIAIQMNHQARLNEEIEGRGPDLEALLHTGRDLLKLSAPGDDYENLSTRLHNITDR